MAFNLTQLLNDRPIITDESELVYRDVFSLVPSKENFYDTEKLESLKQSIAAFGLLQPILIKRENGEDIVVAGHRRRLCCMALVNEGREEFREVFCIYRKKNDLEKTEGAEDILNQIMIIQANNFRDKSDWEKMTEAVRMESLIKELRKTVDIQGKTRSLMKDIIGVSETQMQRYRSISENLLPELMEEFKTDQINVSTAYELSRLSRESQKAAIETYKETGSLDISAAKDLKNQEQIPGQDSVMNHPEYCPDEAMQSTIQIIPLETQLQNFFEGLKRMERDMVGKRDVNLLTNALYTRYKDVSVNSNKLIFAGRTGGVVFNNELQPEFYPWRNLAEMLIERFGKRQQVKMAPVYEEPKNTPKPDNKRMDDHKTDGQTEQSPEETDTKETTLKNEAERQQDTEEPTTYQDCCSECGNFSDIVHVLDRDTGEIREIQFIYCPICGRKLEEDQK